MAKSNIITISEIERIFVNEFAYFADKFAIFQLSVQDARKSQAKYVWHPGVYVWWNTNEGVIKVGRHLTNSRKRALEHIRDNTGEIMKDLADDDQTKLLLFNVKKPSDRHWVAALEVFFEIELSPRIKSERLG